MVAVHDAPVVPEREVVYDPRPQIVREAESLQVVRLETQHVAEGLGRQHVLPDRAEVSQATAEGGHHALDVDLYRLVRRRDRGPVRRYRAPARGRPQAA